MNPTPVKEYLQSLERELKRRGQYDPDILAEIESHLLESFERGSRQGLDPEVACRRALDRFGPAALVAKHFDRERHGTMQKVLLIAAVVLGILIAYVDSRPTWNDTGITVFSLLLSSGFIGLLIRRRPWLYGLAVGLWLPLLYIFRAGQWNMLIVLLFPLVGVYAGWVFRKLVGMVLHPA